MVGSLKEDGPTQHVTHEDGSRIGFEVFGSGPPLVLVHGAFTDRVSNWITVREALAERFTVHAVDRRGRNESVATTARSTLDEFEDVAAVLRFGSEPAFVLGHSYGAHVALGAASLLPDSVRGLILYEPPTVTSLSAETARALDADAERGDWDAFVARFFAEVAQASPQELEAMRGSPVWGLLVTGAPSTLHDIRALQGYDFDPGAFRALKLPVTFLCGSQSPPIQRVVTDALLEALPQAHRVILEGQGHDGMYGDPAGFVEAVVRATGL